MAHKSKRMDVGIWMKLTKVVMLLLIFAGSLAVFQWYKPVIRQNEGMQRRINLLQKQIAEGKGIRRSNECNHRCYQYQQR